MDTQKSGSGNFQDKLSLGSIFIVAGAVLSIAGSFMSWASIGVFSVSGFDGGDGKITAIAGIAALILVVFVYSKEKTRGTVTALLSFPLGLLVMFVATYDGTNVGESGSNALFSASVGTGIYVVFLGGAMVALGGIAMFSGITKDNFYRLGSLSRNDLSKVLAMSLIALLAIGGGYALAKSDQKGPENMARDNEPFIGTSTAETEPQEEPVLQVISKNSRKSEYGSGLEIMGEVKNVGNVDAYEPRISVSLISKGQVVATSSYGEMPSMIPVGMTVPFQTSIQQAPAYDEMRVEAKAKRQSYQTYQYLTVLSQNSRSESDPYGFSTTIYVAGEVQNQSGGDVGTYGGPRIFVWLLDANNNVVKMGTTYMNDPIKSGEKRPYEVTFAFMGAAPDYKTIKVVALGESRGSTSGSSNGQTVRSEEGAYSSQSDAEEFAQSQQPGMTPIDPGATWRDDATLHVIHATPKGGASYGGDYYYFFVEGSFVGSKVFTGGNQNSSVDDNTFAVTYHVFQPGDPHCCPSGGTATVQFQWDGSNLVTLGSMQGAEMSP